MSFKNSKSLKQYLDKIDSSPLLTKEEEQKLLKNIETSQNKIIDSCLRYKIFRQYLIEVIGSQKNLAKVSKFITPESKRKQIREIKEAISETISLIEDKVYTQEIRDKVKLIGLSAITLNSIVNKINGLHSTIKRIETRKEQLAFYFDMKEFSELVDKKQNLKDNKKFINYFCMKNRTSSTKMLQKLHEVDEVLEDIQKLVDKGVPEKSYQTFKNMTSKIRSLEFECSTSRNELVKRNLRLVVSRAKRFVNRGLDFPDLIQEGNIGLIKAIDKHDITKNIKISTYATWWIDQSIRRAISNKSKTIRIPTHMEYHQNVTEVIISELKVYLGREPSKDEIVARAIELGKTEITVDILNKLELAALQKLSIEDSNSEAQSLMDVIPAGEEYDPHVVTEAKFLRKRIKEILATLNPKYEKILRLKYGIGESDETLTMEEIGDKLGCSKQWVGVLRKEAYSDLKKGGHLDDY